MLGRRSHSARGFTLLEALLSAAILAMSVTAITMPFTVGAVNEQVDGRRTLAVALAQELMEEILTRPFRDPQGPSEPGPEPGERRRADFDNLDDYDGYGEPAGQVRSLDGQTLDDGAAAGLSRHVSATYVHVPGQDRREEPTFIRITVRVAYRGQPVVRLKRLVYALP